MTIFLIFNVVAKGLKKWQDHVSTNELLEKVSMKLLSEELKNHGRKMVGQILSLDHKNNCNIAIS